MPAGSDKALAPSFVGAPELFIGDAIDRCPHFRIIRLEIELRPQEPIEEAQHVVAYPCARIDAVRHMPDRNLLELELGPQALPHLARNFAMQLRNPVRFGGKVQRKHRHAEAFLVVERIFAPEAQKFVPIQPQARHKSAEILVHQIDAKALIARGHRRMGRENIGRDKRLHC